MKTTKLLLLACVAAWSALVITTGCTKEKPPPPPPSSPPGVSAGADIQLVLPADSCILTGAVTESESKIKNYLWEKISGPASYKIEHPDSLSTKVRGLQEGTYIFQLTVTDISKLQGKDAVVVNVTSQTPPPPPPFTNKPPIANAGADQIFMSPRNYADLDGSLSHDPDGTVVSFEWTKVAGPNSYEINQTQTSSKAYTFVFEPGAYQFQIQVRDNNGATARDTMNITVLPDSLTRDPSTFKRFNQLQWDNSCTIRINNISSIIPAGASIQVYTRSYDVDPFHYSLSNGWVKVDAVKSPSDWYEIKNDVLIINASENFICDWDLPFHDVLIKWK